MEDALACLEVRIASWQIFPGSVVTAVLRVAFLPGALPQSSIASMT